MTLRRPDLSRGQRMVVETVILVVAAVFLAVLLRGFVAEAFRIPSASMEPQLNIGDRVIVSRTAYKVHDPRLGDNRGNSSDSRVFGQIDQDTIVGRAILRVWPPWRTAFL